MRLTYTGATPVLDERTGAALSGPGDYDVPETAARAFALWSPETVTVHPDTPPAAPAEGE